MFNPLNYAFDKRKGTIIIELRKINDYHNLMVSDNGDGMKSEIDGIKTLKRLYDTMDIPVAYLTAYSDDKMLERAKNKTLRSSYKTF